MTTRKQFRSLRASIAEIFRLRLYIVAATAMTIGVTADPGALMFRVLLRAFGSQIRKAGGDV
jgi:hypothetical protein